MKQDSSLLYNETTTTVQHDDDELYDDACDLGQFMLNPCWYLYMKLTSWWLWCRRHRKGDDLDDSKLCNDYDYNDDKDEKRKTNKKKSFISLFIKRYPKSQLIVYLVGLLTIWLIVFVRLYPLAGIYYPIHRIIGGIVFVLCITSWILVSYGCSSGEITEQTIWKYDTYQYDNILYMDNSTNICPTLNLRKVPRSKYDQYSQKCIPRFDHFCGWIYRPIGEENYREFLWFLFVHMGMCLYGSFMILLILSQHVHQVVVVVSTVPKVSSSSSSSWILSIISVDYYLTIIMIALGSMAFLLVRFISFHLQNISRGMTTNEYYKWKVIRQRHHHHHHHRLLVVNDDLETTTTTTTITTNSNKMVSIKSKSTATANNSSAPLPVNIYDLGIIENFKEVLFPKSLQLQQQKSSSHYEEKNL